MIFLFMFSSFWFFMCIGQWDTISLWSSSYPFCCCSRPVKFIPVSFSFLFATASQQTWISVASNQKPLKAYNEHFLTVLNMIFWSSRYFMCSKSLCEICKFQVKVSKWQLAENMWFLDTSAIRFRVLVVVPGFFISIYCDFQLGAHWVLIWDSLSGTLLLGKESF
jgi:hypothetical protein